MAEYTEPPTIAPGSAALASDFNTYVGENSKYFKDETEGLDGRLSTAESDIVALESSKVSSSQVEEIVVLTQSAYNALTPSSNVLYVIVG